MAFTKKHIEHKKKQIILCWNMFENWSQIIIFISYLYTNMLPFVSFAHLLNSKMYLYKCQLHEDSYKMRKTKKKFYLIFSGKKAMKNTRLKIGKLLEIKWN